MNKITENRMEEALASLKKVEASPFLLTRIQERIRQKEMASTPFVWALGLSFAIILAVNVLGFNNISSQETSPSVEQEMNILLPQNGLYD